MPCRSASPVVAVAGSTGPIEGRDAEDCLRQQLRALEEAKGAVLSSQAGAAAEGRGVPEDCLTQQLRALREAKSAAAALKASGELEVGYRKEMLRRDVPPLQLPGSGVGGGLSEALRRWKAPAAKESPGSSCQVAPSALSTMTAPPDADHEVYAGAADLPSPLLSQRSAEGELQEVCRGVLIAVSAAGEAAAGKDRPHEARPAGSGAGPAGASGGVGGALEAEGAATPRTAGGSAEVRQRRPGDEVRHEGAAPSIDSVPTRAERPRQSSPGRRQASPRPASPGRASPRSGLSRPAPPRPAQQRPASPPRNASPTTRARESRRAARQSAPTEAAQAAAEAPPLLSKREIEAELEQCRRAIASCAQQVTAQSLRELRSLRRPPGAVASILEATAVLLGAVEAQQGRKALTGAPPERKEVELDFREVRKTLQSSLPDRIREISPEEVTLPQFRRLRRLLAMPGFDEELVRSVCPAAVPLAALCRTVGACLSKTQPWAGGEAGPAAAQGLQDAVPAADYSGGRAQAHETAGDRSPAKQPAGRPPAATPRRDAGVVVKPDLCSLSARELQQVSELMVSRPEVGSIVFHGVTDCTDLDLSTLVHMGVGEVLVYPNGSKPPPGQGLNKHATVTLCQCWPPNGLGHLEDEASRSRYRRRIQQMTEDKGARFIDYDCLSGIWKFQVEHF